MRRKVCFPSFWGIAFATNLTPLTNILNETP